MSLSHNNITFQTVKNLLMVDPWTTDEQKPLLLHLDEPMQNAFKDQVVNLFRLQKTEQSLILFTGLFKLIKDFSLLEEYF